MPSTAWLAVGDALVGLWLLWSARRQPRNREAVIAVGAMLLAMAVGLLWLALDDPQPPRPSTPGVPF